MKSKTIKLPASTYAVDLRYAVAKFLKAHLTRVLIEHAGNITCSAYALNISRRTLQMQIMRLEIDVSKIRQDQP